MENFPINFNTPVTHYTLSRRVPKEKLKIENANIILKRALEKNGIRTGSTGRSITGYNLSLDDTSVIS